MDNRIKLTLGFTGIALAAVLTVKDIASNLGGGIELGKEHSEQIIAQPTTTDESYDAKSEDARAKPNDIDTPAL